MKQLPITIIVLLMMGCHPKNNSWQTLDFKDFKLKTPRGWKIIEAKGVDSYVGGLTNGRDTLSFDYGWHTAEIDESESENHLYAQDTINGLTAVLQIPKVEGNGSIVMFIPKVTGSNKFGIAGTNITGTDTILKIYKSIIFTESDTTKNGILVREKFKSYPVGSGQTLFRGKCSSCHTFNKYLSGPAIKEIVNERSAVWIYQFLTNRKSMVADSAQIERENKFEAKCVEFPDLTKKEVFDIVEYIKTI